MNLGLFYILTARRTDIGSQVIILFQSSIKAIHTHTRQLCGWGYHLIVMGKKEKLTYFTVLWDFEAKIVLLVYLASQGPAGERSKRNFPFLSDS